MLDTDVEKGDLKVVEGMVCSKDANIIGGNAITNLTTYNYLCDIAPPQVIIGEYKSLSMANKKALLMPLKTPIGEFDINVFLAEN